MKQWKLRFHAIPGEELSRYFQERKSEITTQFASERGIFCNAISVGCDLVFHIYRHLIFNILFIKHFINY